MTEVRRLDGQNALTGLVDAVDRLLETGAAVTGDIVLTLDGIDLVRIDLRLLITGVQGVPAMDTGSRR